MAECTSCAKPAVARGLCGTHWRQARRSGDLALVIIGPWQVRMWAKVEKTDTCWLWTGSLTSEGYGKMRADGREQYIHRLSYELTNGPVPDGLVVDHLCRVRHCCNPEHLEAVTLKENTLRGEAPSIKTFLTDVCAKGHSMDDAAVTRRHGVEGGRRCRKCAAETNARAELRRQR